VKVVKLAFNYPGSDGVEISRCNSDRAGYFADSASASFAAGFE
jgi:hypothetical protein